MLLHQSSRRLAANSLRRFFTSTPVANQSATPARKRSFLRTAAKGLGGLTALSGAGGFAYMYSDDGRWRSAQVMYFFAKLGVAYYGVEDEEQKHALHREWSQKTLDIVLELGGYYIKAAQTCVGIGYLPQEYSDTFEILLDQCPPRDHAVIAKVFEDDVGCPLEDAFETFDKTPLGAGSIGQVHRATLKGSGKPVVVKIQYPDVEKFFRMDFQTMTWLLSLGDFGDAMRDVMEEFSETMVDEFQYEKEAEYLRRGAQNVNAVFGRKVFIPLPIDDQHPDRPTGRALCTHNVLTMEAVEGVPIKQCLQDMMAAWAESQGKTLEEVKAEMKEMYSDPKKVDELMANASPASETMTSLYIWGVKVVNWLFRTNYTVPLNGPRIIRLLCDVHAHELFMDGLFNSDPHAGNILQMEDGRLGLIDYGACDELEHEQREAFARLCIALADEDDEGTVQAFKDFGFESEKNSEQFLLCYAMLMYHRGFHKDDMKRCGIPDEIGVMDVEMYLNQTDHIKKMKGPVATTQRMVMVLLGLSQEIGAGGLSIASMFKPTAVKYLKSRGLSVKKEKRA